MKRTIFSLILFFATFVSPWWAVLLAGCLAVIYFKNFYEIISLGFIVDILYSTEPLIWGLNIRFTIYTAVFFYLVTNLKKRMLVR